MEATAVMRCFCPGTVSAEFLAQGARRHAILLTSNGNQGESGLPTSLHKGAYEHWIATHSVSPLQIAM
jgi:hypothetical protein